MILSIRREKKFSVLLFIVAFIESTVSNIAIHDTVILSNVINVLAATSRIIHTKGSEIHRLLINDWKTIISGLSYASSYLIVNRVK